MTLYLIKIPAQADLLSLETVQTLRNTVVIMCSQKIITQTLKRYTHPEIDYYDTDMLSFDKIAQIIHMAHQIDKNVAYLCPDESNHRAATNECKGQQMMRLLQNNSISYQIMPFHSPEYHAIA